MGKTNFFKRIGEFFSNLFFPEHLTCDFCKGELDHKTKYRVCSNCQETLPRPNKICKKCGSEIEEDYEYCLACRDKQVFYKVARAPFVYGDKIKSAIHNLKYNNAKFLSVSLGNFMTNTYIEHNFEADIIIPVPLTPQRQKMRGYNQSELLANQVSRNLSLPTLTNVLVRTKFSHSQTELSFKERYKNLEECFAVENQELIKGKKILLIDDVMTTGATVEACSKLLVQHGANTVYVLTAARTTSIRK